MDEAARIREVYAERRAGEAHSERYSPLDPSNLYLLQRLEAAIIALLRDEGIRSLAGLRILDIGCGSGFWLRRFASYGAATAGLAGIDLHEAAIDEGRSLAPGIDLRTGDAAALPWADGSFDIVTQFTVFSSVLDAKRRQAMAAEMRRVLAPGGIVVWYDMTLNPTNRDVTGLGRNDVRALFPGARIRFRKETLAPPLGRLVAPRSALAARLLEAVPLLRTHLLAAIQP